MKLKIVEKKEQIILERMLQLFLHDISSLFPMEFDSNTGLYDYDSLEKYFNNSGNFSYFIYNEEVVENIVGFILLDKLEDSIVIQEMFILNNYKNKKIGTKAVNTLFDMHKTKWIIKSLPCSEASERFWERTIRNYTNNNFNVEHIGKYNRAIFTFSNWEV